MLQTCILLRNFFQKGFLSVPFFLLRVLNPVRELVRGIGDLHFSPQITF